MTARGSSPGGACFAFRVMVRRGRLAEPRKVSAPRARGGLPFRTSTAFADRSRALGERVRVERQQRGWTLEALAERMDADFRHLQRVEVGQSNPTLATLLRLAEALGIELPALLGEPTSSGADPRAHRSLNPATPGEGPKRHGRKDTTYGDLLQGPADTLLPAVAANIRAVRTTRGLSQAALAKALGLAKQHVQRIEAGRQNLTIKTLESVAHALGVAPSRLLDRHVGPRAKNMRR